MQRNRPASLLSSKVVAHPGKTAQAEAGTPSSRQLSSVAGFACVRCVCRMQRCWTASASVPWAGAELLPFCCCFDCARTYGGRRESPRLKSGLGKTVRDLTRMLVVVSSRVRCGLNWYLYFAVWSARHSSILFSSSHKQCCARTSLSDRANNNSLQDETGSEVLAQVIGNV